MNASPFLRKMAVIRSKLVKKRKIVRFLVFFEIDNNILMM